MFNFRLIGIIFFLSSCMCSRNYGGEISGHMLVIDEKSLGSSIALKVGECVTINMRNPGSGGYLFKEPEFDPNVIHIQGQRSLPPALDSGKGGDFGRVIYVFEAAAPGETDIIFRVYRPWEHDIPAQEYVRVKTVVAR